MKDLMLRLATSGDTAAIYALVHELAVFEKLEHELVATVEGFREQLFGPHPAAEVLVAEQSGAIVGMALFFRTFSTFLGKPGIWLEDLIVRESHRGEGIGKKLLTRLAQITVERNYGRLEWSVLDWNVKAIQFYRSLGARPMDEWTTYRLAGDALQALGKP